MFVRDEKIYIKNDKNSDIKKNNLNNTFLNYLNM
jgi:hypothetical protein